MDSTLTLTLLGLITLASTIQAAVLVALLVAGRRLSSRLDDLEREIRAPLERVSDAADQVKAVADAAARHLPMIEHAVDDSLHKIRRATDLAVRPLRPLAIAVAVWRGIKQGTAVYRRLRTPGRALLH